MMKKLFFIVALLSMFSPWVTPPVALIAGILFGQFSEHPYRHLNGSATQILLQISVIGLAFGMNVTDAVQAGKDGFFFTVLTIAGVTIVGYLLGKALKINKAITYLISIGTAICGGSAIATISPIIRAKEGQVSIALGTVFILNSIALFIFPLIGSTLDLTQEQFGMWCAIAIHDTSSVVAAADSFGNRSLEIATTVKLGRALWIFPLAFLLSFLAKNENKKPSFPYFIGLFMLAMIANTYIPLIQQINHFITGIAKALLTMTLFLIGIGLNLRIIKNVGLKPFIHGTILWMLTAIISIIAIMNLY
jgi:uncharacterized integral membrane protein (TIGR00698 family)